MRILLARVLRADSDLDAFCGDYFEDVHARFTSGMDRVSKVNQLFDRVGTSRIVSALRRAHPDAVRQHEAVLELGPATATTEPTPAQDAAPTPRYPDEATRLLSMELRRAQARKRALTQVGADTAEIDREILHLRRQLREGGQLREGDALSDGRYLLIRRVGRGGFAVVWEAHDEQRQERVAIKVLHSELAGDLIRRERFFRGARMMAELADDAIVRVLEPHAEEGGYHYFVMELLGGGDLREAVLAGRLAGEALLDAILRVGGALAKAHAKGLVHRDIKPANILLDAVGGVRLTDFDLVGGAGTTGGTRTGAIGSWIYAAPELMHRPQDADARADVYGLGMTTIFSLHGAELSMQVLRGAETIIDGLTCNAVMKAVLRQAVDWSPAVRFRDAAAFSEALRAARKTGPDVAPDRALPPAEGPTLPTSAASPVAAEGPLEPSGNSSLVIIRHPDLTLVGQRQMLTQELTRIGRGGKDVDWALEDDSISRQHCHIEHRGDRWFVRDLGSSNGTWVNEDRLAHTAEKEILAGDRIRFGEQVILRFFGSDSAVPARSRSLFHNDPVDGLTGLPSQAHMLDALRAAVAAAARDDSSMSVLAIHVDQMDRIDDDESEPIGDRVLQDLAQGTPYSFGGTFA